MKILNSGDILETIEMLTAENLDVRTVTMGISLLDCIDSDLDTMNEKIYNKITTKAKDLVATGDEIAADTGKHNERHQTSCQSFSLLSLQNRSKCKCQNGHCKSCDRISHGFSVRCG